MQNHLTISEKAAILPKVRVGVVDDHPLFRAGAIQVLAMADGIEVVGEGATGADALRIAREVSPDIILLDLHLPGGGLQAAARITAEYPNVRIIVLTASESEQDVTSALQAGARGYILKGSSALDVAKTIQTVAQGNSYVAPCLAAQLLIKGSQLKEVAKENAHDLTAREEEIFELVSRGMSNKEIGLRLQCTERTIKHHMTKYHAEA